MKIVLTPPFKHIRGYQSLEPFINDESYEGYISRFTFNLCSISFSIICAPKLDWYNYSKEEFCEQVEKQSYVIKIRCDYPSVKFLGSAYCCYRVNEIKIDDAFTPEECVTISIDDFVQISCSRAIIRLEKLDTDDNTIY